MELLFLKFTYNPYKYRKIHVSFSRGCVAPPRGWSYNLPYLNKLGSSWLVVILRHGTRVHLLPTKRHGTATALSVRPMDVPQQGLTVGVDNQVNYRGRSEFLGRWRRFEGSFFLLLVVFPSPGCKKVADLKL